MGKIAEEQWLQYSVISATVELSTWGYVNTEEEQLWRLQDGVLGRGILRLSLEGLEVSQLNKAECRELQVEGRMFKGTGMGEFFKEFR